MGVTPPIKTVAHLRNLSAANLGTRCSKLAVAVSVHFQDERKLIAPVKIKQNYDKIAIIIGSTRPERVGGAGGTRAVENLRLIMGELQVADPCRRLMRRRETMFSRNKTNQIKLNRGD
jgi:hypothetical protein